MIEEVISNDFFVNIVLNLKIIPNKNFETATKYEIENPVQNAVNKFKNHPSIRTI